MLGPGEGKERSENIKQYFLRSEKAIEGNKRLNTPEKRKESDTTHSSEVNKMASNNKSNSSNRSTGGSVTNEDLKDLIQNLIENLDDKLSKRIDRIDAAFIELKTDLSNVELDVKLTKSTILEIQESAKFQDERTKDLELKTEDFDEMKKKIAELEETVLYNEFRSRKYNLLIYGLEKLNNEEISKTVSTFFVNELHAGVEYVKTLPICNQHRIPKNPHNRNSKGPEAIIVKFMNFSDRNYILTLSHRARLSGKSDLPQALKKKRAELSGTAYILRKQKNLQTRIKETFKDVWIECRKDKDSPWKKYTETG